MLTRSVSSFAGTPCREGELPPFGLRFMDRVLTYFSGPGTTWLKNTMNRMVEGRAAPREIDAMYEITKQIEG